MKLVDAPRPQAWLAGFGFAVVNFVAVAQLTRGVEYFWFLWLTPALLGLCLWARAQQAPAKNECLVSPA